MPRLATHCICCDHTPLERQSAVLMPFVAQRALGWTPCEITPDWGLRDLPKGWAQALCCSLHCPACGTLFLDMRFDDDEMARLYHGYRGAAYTAQREAFEPGYAQRNAGLVQGDAHIPAVEALLKPWLPAQPAVLDWGGDTGLNTPLRQQARLHHVFDISGKPVVDGAMAVGDPTAAGTAYDLIVLSNVLEHVPDPAALLAQISPLLGAGSRLYVEVPYEAVMRQAATDTRAWQLKRHWHEHVNFFSEAGLRQLLSRLGLRLLQVQPIAVPDSAAVQLGLVCERG